MEKTDEKYTFIILIFTLGLILTITGLAYHYRKEMDITQRVMNVKNQLFPPREISVKFHLLAGIGDKSLRVKYSVPCKNIKQKEYITKRIPRIKHELLMSMSNQAIAQSIEERDFKAIKKNALQVINSYSTEPIKRLYVEFFFLN